MSNKKEDHFAMASGRRQQNVSQNPLTNQHRGLEKVVRELADATVLVKVMMQGQKTFQSDDPRVKLLLHLATASGQVEGYMLGEQWSNNARQE